MRVLNLFLINLMRIIIFFLDPPYDCTFNNYNGSVFDKKNHKLLREILNLKINAY